MRTKVTKRDQAFFDSLTKSGGSWKATPAPISGHLIGKEMYQNIKNTAIEKRIFIDGADWNIAFLYAETEGLIDRLSNDEKEMYMGNVIFDLKHESITSSDPEVIQNILNSTESLADECRKRFMQSHFQKMVDGRIN